MKISTKGRYAVRLMYDLAIHHTGDWIALKDVSKRQNISVKYLEQIVRQLGICGYLKSLRGPYGGYQLARKPEDYTIYEILKITEGSLQPVACLDDPVNQCERYRDCPTIEIWEGLGKVVYEYLNNITLQELVDHAKLKGENDFVI
ncbi:MULTISPECIES: RrF2 family transcriptional regulator [Anaerostipes]|uniref:RrF2 family transcriptional regulator n=1 Tax=Anaerostipes TaxID=207244 RepID=UPI0009518EC3|nr:MULTISPECIES: Rrf2 family transcriptional regulator [Anaerostipes]OLR58304.1 Rrf2 family transcriptional regulator [Anaerostipes sp. 494a]